MYRLQQRVEDLVEIGPVGRNHAGDQVARLGVGVEEVEPGDVQIANRPDRDENDAEIPGVTDQGLARAEPPPHLGMAAGMFVDRHLSCPRTQVLKNSPMKTRAMIVSRIARLKS